MRKQTRIAAYIKDPEVLIDYYKQLVHCYRLKRHVVDYVHQNVHDFRAIKIALVDLQFLISTQLKLIREEEHEFKRLQEESEEVLSFKHTKGDTTLHDNIVNLIHQVMQGKREVLEEENNLVRLLSDQHDNIDEFLQRPSMDKVNEILAMITDEEQGLLSDLGLA